METWNSLPVSVSIATACLLRFTVYCNWNIGGEDRTIAFLKREGGEDSGEPLLHHVSEKGVIHHHFPINYILKPWRLGVRFYQIIKFGIFQYVWSLVHLIWIRTVEFMSNLVKYLLHVQVIIKTLTASLSLILQPFGVYCDGEFKWGCG